MPLRVRLTALFTLASSLVVVLGGWLYLHQLRAGLLDATDASVLSRMVPLRTQVSILAHQRMTAPTPADSDTGGLLTQILRPDGSVAEESPSLAGAALLPPTPMSGAATVLRTTEVGAMPYRVAAAPVVRPEGTWVVLVAAPLVELHETVERLRHSLFVAGGLVVLLAAQGAWLLGSAALRPVDRMRRSVEAMTADDLSVRVGIPPGRDELSALGVTFNALLDRLALTLAGQRQFVADAGHELRGPLAVLQMELELADRPQRTRDELAAAVKAAAGEVERLARLANDLLFLARSDDGQLKVTATEVELLPLLQQSLATHRLQASQGEVRIELRCAATLTGYLDADRFRHCLDNLLANAVHAAGPGGWVEIEAAEDSGMTTVSVRDSGPGFPPAFLSRAFERFTRPDSARSDVGGGSGLGLAIVDAVAKSHGGWAVAANGPHGGALVTVSLPRQTEN